MTSAVNAIPAAPSAEAADHFRRRLSLETDCADVHQAFREGTVDFVLLDVRGPGLFAASHVAGAVNLPHRAIDAAALDAWPAGTLFVVYCAGPHCNGADRAALRIASLGRPVKLMIGGLTGWIDEGFALATGAA